MAVKSLLRSCVCLPYSRFSLNRLWWNIKNANEDLFCLQLKAASPQPNGLQFNAQRKLSGEVWKNAERSRLSTAYVHQLGVDRVVMVRAGLTVFPAYRSHPMFQFFRVSKNNANMPLRAPDW